MELTLLGLREKVALVTGGAMGIGKASALYLARAGCHVAIADIDGEGARKTAAEVKDLGRRAIAVTADVRSQQGIDLMIARAAQDLGRLDVAVNNVGGLAGHYLMPFLDVTPQVYDDIVANNLRATFWCCMAEAKAMIARKSGGAIVNIASIAGMRGVQRNAPYAAAKAGIINLTQSLALELAAHGIRVNAVAPGTTITEKGEAGEREGRFKPVAEANPM